MTSSGNELERWTHRQGGRIGELVGPVTSPENDNPLSPVKSVSSVDHLLHLPGKVDSAYSSFSGGSNVPEYPTPLCYDENCCLPPEQVQYMDSEYVRGIYNLSAGASDLRSLHPYKAPDLSIRSNSHSTSHAESCGSTPPRGTLNEGLLPLAAPPPSPPTRLDSYKVARHLENSRGRRSSGGHGGCSVQDSQLAERDVPRSQHRDEVTEQHVAAARRKTLENKGLSSDSTKEVSVPKIQGFKMEENGEWSPSQQPIKRSNAHIFSRPSSFIFQEYLKTDSVANVPKILSAYNSVHAYKIPQEMSSRTYHPVCTNPHAVNDTHEDKQYPCGVRKPAFGEADLQSSVPEPSQRRRSSPCARCPPRAEPLSDADEDVFEDSCDFKYVESAPLIKSPARKLNGCTVKNQCCEPEGKMGSDVREPLLNQQAKMQRSSPSRSYDTVEAEHARCEESDQGNKQCYDSTSQMSFFRPKEGSTSQFLHEIKKDRQADNSRPDVSTHLEQEEPPAPYQKYRPEVQKQLPKQFQDDLAGEQITRQTTPMLYYLSGGKTTNILHHNKLTQCQEDSRRSPKEFTASSSSGSARCLEAQRENPQLQRISHHHRCGAHDLLEAEDLILGSPASSLDESFKNDYREKLKVAQKKVLRETSFKRKDLQMSLPVRLRQKPSKRPSIEHLRSFSLSSASEDAKPAPCSPPHLESLESFNRDEEIKRPQAGRIGGRKRITKEQKKLCYSEPEKLDQLADKEVPWGQVRGEIAEQDIVAARRQLEDRGRALSSSSISRTELKQIQHSALIEYMERKINQRPSGSQQFPLQKPPLQKRLSHPRWPPGKASNPNGSRKVQNNEVFCQDFSKGDSPDVFPPSAFVPSLNVTSRHDPGSAAAAAETSKHDLSPSAADESGASECTSAESLPQAGDPAPGRARERSKSTPSSYQDAEGRVADAAAPSRRCESCLDPPSFCDPEEDGCENHEYKGNDITERAGCQDNKEPAPETSVLIRRSGSEDDAQVEKELRTKSLNSNALTKHPEQQPVASQEQIMCCHTARPHQGDKHAAKGLVTKETSVHSSQDDVLPERDTRLLERRLQSAEDQRYEELAMEIIAKDSSLVDILMPHPVRKTALDLMEGLFPVNLSMLDKPHRKKGDVQESEKSSRDATEECPESERSMKRRSEDPTSKGNQVLNRSRDSTDDLDDITSKKLELISSLRLKLQTLWEERELVLSEARECAERGEELEATVRDVCKPNEFERYMMFIGDLEKVVSLLLCLSSRLARVQNAMRRIDGNTDAEEKQSLNERHKLLSRQREDAKDLKENLDRRERVVSGILAKYLTDQQLQDYRRFVQVKTSLLIEQKDLEEQIKFCEEQLDKLEKSIPL